MGNAMHLVDQTWINGITWRAIYNDGKALYEIMPDGTRNRYESIDRYRLARFDLVDASGKRIFSVFPRYGRQIVFRRRRFFHGAPGAENPLQWTVILVGWHFRVSFKAASGESFSKSLKWIAYIYPNGKIDFDDERNDLIIREQEEI